MPKPKNKEELLIQSQKNFNQLLGFLDGLTSSQIKASFISPGLNKNIRDVIAHLYHWNIMALKWYKEGMKDIKPDMPAKGHTWQTLPKLNEEINAMYLDQSYSSVLKLLKKSYQPLLAIINKHSNKELFEKKKYAWTGSTSMGAYLTANASSHYVWAYKLIRKKLPKN